MNGISPALTWDDRLRAMLRDSGGMYFSQDDLDVARRAAEKEWPEFNIEGCGHPCVLLWGAAMHAVERALDESKLPEHKVDAYETLHFNSLMQWRGRWKITPRVLTEDG